MSSWYDPSRLNTGGAHGNHAGGGVGGSGPPMGGVSYGNEMMLDGNGMMPMDMPMGDAGMGMGDMKGGNNGFTPSGNGMDVQAHDGQLGHATGMMQQQHQQQQPMQGDVVMSGAGAGPLPAGYGMATQGGGSTLTEFTKRRNWSQRIIEELKDFLHILTPDGRIIYASPSCQAITGHDPRSLTGKFIGEFVHPDDRAIFMREFNESIASGNALRFFYRFKREDGGYTIFECDGHPHISPEVQMQMGDGSEMSSVGICKGFFMMARPYPCKNAALLDSFLEHKIENERLLKRIDELKREEVEDNEEQDKLIRDHASPTASATLGGARAATDTPPSGPAAATPDYQGMPPPAKPTISNTALTRQNLDSAL